jgi:hypothetical protein
MEDNLMKEGEIIEKMREYPELKERFEQLIAIVENTKGDATRADDAEYQVIEQMRKLGQDTLQSWANRQSKKMVERVSEQKPNMRRHVKKNSSGTQPMEK